MFLMFHLPVFCIGPFSRKVFGGVFSMNLKRIAGMAGVAALALAASACMGIPDEMTVAEYCAKPDNTNKDICKVYVEVDGQKQALSQTNMSLTQARSVADEALRNANRAQQSADAAQATANKALEQAQFNCSTKTIQRTKVGSCDPGYKVVACNQTRFTFRAGGPSIMRAIDDTQCRFQDQVLEVQVRCCTAGPAPLVQPTEAVQPVQPTNPAQPGQSS
jgi:hypothetical protein